MGRRLERFKNICKEKGVFMAFLKIISYTAFILRKKRIENIWRDACLKSGKAEIRGWNTGPKIYWEGQELTKDAGINSSVFINGKWHDSSKAKWRIGKVGTDSIVINNSWRKLPLRQVWTLSHLDNGRISCEVKTEAEKDIEFIEQKFTVMLSGKYNIWLDSSNTPVRFPQFKDWTDIREVRKDSNFIGARSDIDKALPAIFLRKQDPQSRVFAQIQNSDFRTKCRLLNFWASSRDMDLKCKSGQGIFFKMEIEVK